MGFGGIVFGEKYHPGVSPMAIDYKIFVEKVCANLYADVKFERFLLRVRRQKRLYRKVLDYRSKGWGKRDRVKVAKRELDSFTDRLELSDDGVIPTLRKYVAEHLSHAADTSWKQTKQRHYNNYIDKELGVKRLDKIMQDDIRACIAKQERLGLKPRTVKTTLELLRPLFRDAIINRYIAHNPCDGIKIKLPKSKKIVSSASDKLIEAYAVIMDVFRDDPFYRSLFLFALNGRRKGEILSLRWEDVSFEYNYVILRDPKNEEMQKMYLPADIKEALLEFVSDDSDWIYPTPRDVTKPLHDIRKTVAHIKKRVPWFGMHYLRNVIVSAMAEQGRAAIEMSGALGHMSAKTIDTYLSLNYLQGSTAASETITQILSHGKAQPIKR